MKVEMIPKVYVKKEFITISEISSANPRPSTNERINLIGVVHKLGNVRLIEHTSRYRLNIEIVDPLVKPYQSIVLCIWEFSGDRQ